MSSQVDLWGRRASEGADVISAQRTAGVAGHRQTQEEAAVLRGSV